tara:strand:+ start:625 stop:1497 length:873 start_codon:yes stop_codon:yes gene_type:complete
MALKAYLSKDVLTWRRLLLTNGGNQSELDWLLDIGGGLSWVDLQKLYLFPEEPIELDKSLEELEKIWRLHIDEQKPLQHIIGKCYWRDFQLEINPDALIPRQETELLVDFALEKLDKKFKGSWVDLGTGSGALAVALSRALSRWDGHVVDSSQSALSLAKRNLERLSSKSSVQLHLGDWWEPLKDFQGSIDIAISNPPYIPASILKTLDPIVINHEPKLALSGGEDGLDACRKIVFGAVKGLRSGGWLIFEHHHDQSEKALQLLKDCGFKDVSFENDFRGVKRFAMGRNS